MGFLQFSQEFVGTNFKYWILSTRAVKQNLNLEHLLIGIIGNLHKRTRHLQNTNNTEILCNLLPNATDYAWWAVVCQDRFSYYYKLIMSRKQYHDFAISMFWAFGNIQWEKHLNKTQPFC